MKVVIIDSDPFIVSLLVEIFHRRGYEVVTYSDPTAYPLYSLNSCQCQMVGACPDIIITDFDMPNVNGVTFFETLRKNGCNSVTIALMSAHLIPREALERASKLEVKFFAKPFHRSQLENWLDRIEPRLLQESQSKAMPSDPVQAQLA